MIEEEQSSVPSVTSTMMQPDGEVPLAHEDANSSISDDHGRIDQYDSYFIGKVRSPISIVTGNLEYLQMGTDALTSKLVINLFSFSSQSHNFM